MSFCRSFELIGASLHCHSAPVLTFSPASCPFPSQTSSADVNIASIVNWEGKRNDFALD